MTTLDKTIHKTAGAIAKEWGISAAKLKKKLDEKSVEPAVVKGACKYYDVTKLDDVKGEIE